MSGGLGPDRWPRQPRPSPLPTQLEIPGLTKWLRDRWKSAVNLPTSLRHWQTCHGVHASASASALRTQVSTDIAAGQVCVYHPS